MLNLYLPPIVFRAALSDTSSTTMIVSSESFNTQLQVPIAIRIFGQELLSEIKPRSVTKEKLFLPVQSMAPLSNLPAHGFNPQVLLDLVDHITEEI